LMNQRNITAFVYPTLRRKPEVIGKPQQGSNCQLSAATGFPAMSMPAGFTADGLPVGMDLLGQPWSEPTLLKVAYAYERLVAPRKPPKTGPPLTFEYREGSPRAISGRRRCSIVQPCRPCRCDTSSTMSIGQSTSTPGSSDS